MGKGKRGFDVFIQTRQMVFASVIRIYMIWMLLVFPIYILPVWTDKQTGKLLGGYYTILFDKYRMYITVTVIVFITLFLLWLTIVFVDRTEFKGQWMRMSLDSYKKACKEWRFWIPQWSLLLFLAVATVSTFVSPFVYESFWGNEGRQVGLFMIILLVGSFLAVGSHLKYSRCYLELFLVALFCADIFGILQYLGYDCFYMRQYVLSPKDFVSTFGNINSYTSVVAMSMAVAAVLYICEDSTLRRVLYFAAYIVSCIAIITGNSDNAYLSIGILFSVLPFFVWKDVEGVCRYLLLVVSLIVSMKLIYFVNTRYPNRADGVEGIFAAIAPRNGVWILIAVLLLLAIALRLIKIKWMRGNMGYRWLRGGWLALLLLAAIAVCYVLYDVNVRGNEAFYEGMLGFLKFDDEWGTHRGIIWRAMVECYKDFPPLQKVFGFGPDTTGIFFKFSDFRPVLLERYNEYVDVAHNDYLQYFVTIGPVGLMAYLAFIGSWGTKVLRHSRKTFYQGDGQGLAIFFAALCFLTQAGVNINSPINLPILWCFFGLGMSYCRAGIEVN